MKIAEMIQKISTYNEIAEMIRQPKMELRFYVRFGLAIPVYDLKSFRRYVRKEYIPCMADAILAYDGYSFDEEVTICCTDKFGDDLHEEITFEVYAA